MTKEDWQNVLEESRTAAEHLRFNISTLSDVDANANRRLAEHYEVVEKSATLVDECRRLLDSVSKLRDVVWRAEVQIDRLGELVSNELVRTGEAHDERAAAADQMSAGSGRYHSMCSD